MAIADCRSQPGRTTDFIPSRCPRTSPRKSTWFAVGCGHQRRSDQAYSLEPSSLTSIPELVSLLHSIGLLMVYVPIIDAGVTFIARSYTN
ncbi:hypothetical protein BS17DRAFT_783845 [Gyrodon lividus]|nr:hypothetical protein BS17DRAFT_783845 [Gyrodon lividus]